MKDEAFTKMEQRVWNKAYFADRIEQWYPKDYVVRDKGAGRNALRGWKKRSWNEE